MNTSAKFNALFRDVSVGALSALTKRRIYSLPCIWNSRIFHLTTW